MVLNQSIRYGSYVSEDERGLKVLPRSDKCYTYKAVIYKSADQTAHMPKLINMFICCSHRYQCGFCLLIYIKTNKWLNALQNPTYLSVEWNDWMSDSALANALYFWHDDSNSRGHDLSHIAVSV